MGVEERLGGLLVLFCEELFLLFSSSSCRFTILVWKFENALFVSSVCFESLVNRDSPGMLHLVYQPLIFVGATHSQ